MNRRVDIVFFFFFKGLVLLTPVLGVPLQYHATSSVFSCI